MIKRILTLTAALALPAAGFAQTLTSVTVEPAAIQAGESVKVTVNFDSEGPINCGLRLHFGDGAPIDYKINQQKDLALAVPRTYAKAGEYRIMAEPKTVGTILKCSGRNQAAFLKVAAAAPPVAAPSTQAPAAPGSAAASAYECPDGWTLDRKSVRKKTGAFTCQAAPGTRITARLSCPGDMTYFENRRKGLMGCRP